VNVNEIILRLHASFIVDHKGQHAMADVNSCGSTPVAAVATAAAGASNPHSSYLAHRGKQCKQAMVEMQAHVAA
jgi:hypothetical protein